MSMRVNFSKQLLDYRTANVGLSNILYSERFKESSKFFFRREPGKRAHR